MKRLTFALVLLFSIPAFAQFSGQWVSPVQYPQAQPTVVIDYDGSNNPIYIGYAAPFGPWNNGSVPASFSWTRAAATLTSIVVATNVGTATTSTAHGLRIGNQVVVAGSTTAALNGTYRIATIPSTTTFTITTSGVADATYNNAAMTLTTTAPRTTVAIWNIECLNYTSSNLIDKHWVNGNPKTLVIWDSRATYPCQ